MRTPTHARLAIAGVAACAATAVIVGTLPAVGAAPEAAPLAAGAAKDRGRDDHPKPPKDGKIPTSVGFGGAVATVDPTASEVGLDVLKRGGNAADAAVAAAATLGVTEPYSAGIGGGGYFVYYDAAAGEVSTVDGRETAPAAMPSDAFIDPATGAPYPFSPERVTSGISVGVPGTPATWERVLDRWGSWSLRKSLKPAIKVARSGFRVDQTFRDQTLDNKVRFEAFTSTSDLFLPGGDAPAVGSKFRNRDLARTYRTLARRGVDAFYTGPLAQEIVDAVQSPPTTATTTLPVPPGVMETADLASYRTLDQAPTSVSYRGYDVYGMAPSSSGGSTVGESLNILETADLAGMDTAQTLHYYLEATALAFADRGAYLGDPAFTPVPLDDLLSDTFAATRACAIDPEVAAMKPVLAGDVTSYDGTCPTPSPAAAAADDTENVETTNLTVADRWGNVAEYTLTIEQTGGSGIVVPDRGFILNNELTDFSTVFNPTDPNRIEPGKRPRSSMSPTIVLKDGKPFVALGSPGGSTIITTVLQILINRIDLGMTIDEALAAPRATQRNTANVVAEPDFISAYGTPLMAYGHTLQSSAEIGAATAIEFGPRGLLTAAAEPTRRGGGAALVVHHKRRR